MDEIGGARRGKISSEVAFGDSLKKEILSVFLFLVIVSAQFLFLFALEILIKKARFDETFFRITFILADKT